jgi:hypothetical protein
VPHQAPARGSIGFALQVGRSLVSREPMAVSRWVTPAMRACISYVRARHKFDVVVCDFLIPAPNFDSLAGCVRFQHNVENGVPWPCPVGGFLYARVPEYCFGPSKPSISSDVSVRRLPREVCRFSQVLRP